MADFIMLVSRITIDSRFGIQQGDIIDVIPTSHQLNENEKRMCLLIPVTGITADEASKLKAPQYEGGEDTPIMDGKKVSVLVAKRKNAVKFTTLTSSAASTGVVFNAKTASDTSKAYQPFVDAKATVNIKSVPIVTNKVTNSTGTVG